ncbi:hypothetical protein B9Z55_017372 [Caenorhabditis nigoni]|nr:hypothetical protein B9Z55_017372 [Caenorhabditis nigoni]
MVKSGKPEEPSILEELKQAYRNLEESRRQTFKSDGPSRLVFFEEMDNVCRIDINLIMDTLMKTFTSLSSPMQNDQHRCLISNFLGPFIVVDQCFKSVDSEFTILADENYVDTRDLHEHFQSSNRADSKVAETSLFLAPYWKQRRNIMGRTFKELKMDISEFLVFCALIYWDFGLHEQSDECIEICLQKRSRILKELKFYYEKSLRSENDASLRIGEIMLALQMVQKSMKMMEEYKTISIIYDLCAKHCPLFQMSEGKL